jgi:hypothetical protein
MLAKTPTAEELVSNKNLFNGLSSLALALIVSISNASPRAKKSRPDKRKNINTTTAMVSSGYKSFSIVLIGGFIAKILVKARMKAPSSAQNNG